MKKRLITVILLLMLVPYINTYAGETPPDALLCPVEIAMRFWQLQTGEITEDFVYDFDVRMDITTFEAATWQEAYTALLHEYMGKSESIFFTLFDFDKSGTPELIVMGDYAGDFWYELSYT